MAPCLKNSFVLHALEYSPQNILFRGLLAFNFHADPLFRQFEENVQAVSRQYYPFSVAAALILQADNIICASTSWRDRTSIERGVSAVQDRAAGSHGPQRFAVAGPVHRVELRSQILKVISRS